VRALRACGPELGEILPPALVYARRIEKILLVEGVEKGGVAAMEGRWFEHAGKRTGRPIV
jgi:hypothetical protein